MSRDIYKKRRYVCGNDHRFEDFRWESEGLPHECPACGSEEVEPYYGRNFFGTSAYVNGDECDVMINHAICNADGTPKRYTSKAEIRRAAAEAGWTIEGETPKLTMKQNEEKAQWQESVNKKWGR